MRVLMGQFNTSIERFSGKKKTKEPQLKAQAHPMIVKGQILDRLDRAFDVVQGDRQPPRDFEATLYTSWKHNGLDRSVEATVDWDYDTYTLNITGYAWKDTTQNGQLLTRQWNTQTFSRITLPSNPKDIKPENIKPSFLQAQQKVNAWTEKDLRLIQNYDA